MTESALPPRAQRTRDALIGAGLVLLGDRPIEALAIDDIVAAARVAKGSFFNHFADKPAFGDAVAATIRLEVEQWVERANAGVDDPLVRLSGGMIAGAAYALANPLRAAILARATVRMTPAGHPLNAGLHDDIGAALTARMICPPAIDPAVTFWLGCCQTAMAAVLEAGAPRTERAAAAIAAQLGMALHGLGADAGHARVLSDAELVRQRLERLLGGADGPG